MFEWHHFVDRSALFTNSVVEQKPFWSVVFKEHVETLHGIVRLIIETLRCYAEECAFSLSTQAQDHVWDLVEYKRAEPAHCPTGATSGGAGCERSIMRGKPPSFFMHAPCSLNDWGVRT